MTHPLQESKTAIVGLILFLLMPGCAERVRSTEAPKYNSSACAERALRSGARHDGANQVLVRACSQDDARACSLLGVLQETNKPTAAPARAAWHLYAGSCRSGYAHACANLADVYRRQAAQATRAAELYEYACLNGVPRACDSLAVMHHDGTGVSRDGKRAVQLGYTACSLGYGPACLRLGYAQERLGRAKVAAQWYQEGCKQGALEGCDALDRLFEQSRR